MLSIVATYIIPAQNNMLQNVYKRNKAAQSNLGTVHTAKGADFL